MTTYLTLAFSVSACLLGGILQKHCSSKFKNKPMMYHVYNACVSFVCMTVLLAISGDLGISAFTALSGLAFGIVTALASVFFLKALDTGPYAYTAVITSLSAIIPTLSGHLFWGEEISPVQLLGVVLMLFCFVFSVDFSGEKKEVSVRWFLCSAGSFCCTGLVGVMQKWHQNTPFREELDGFLVIAFAVSTLFSFCTVLIKRKKAETDIKGEITPALIVLMTVAGICAAANNRINLYLSGVMDSAVFFPVVNGGGLVLASMASFFLFKEKLSPKKWVGIFIGIIAVLLLCNPF